MDLALDGITVVDISQGVPGPLCSTMLGDLGAEVIKLEPPDGDWLRTVGPFTESESDLFIRLNRSKKGICVNLKDPAGQDIVRRLARAADVFIEGYTTGVVERLGLSYAALSAHNRGLIYCAISGYGSQGPLARTPATELDLQAFVGKFRQLGTPDEPPLRVGFDIISVNAAWLPARAFWPPCTRASRVEKASGLKPPCWMLRSPSCSGRPRRRATRTSGAPGRCPATPKRRTTASSAKTPTS